MKIHEILAAREKAKKEAANPTAGGNRPAPAPAPAAGKKGVIRVLRTRETPNPDALQFVLNAQVLDFGNKSYSSRKDCEEDPMGQALFDLGGVQNVYVMQNFVTVTKDPGTAWVPLKNQIWATIDRHITLYRSGDQAAPVEIDVENFAGLSEEEKLQAIEMVLNRSIRANLARDGGGVEVKGIRDNQVSIQYHGACGSCATSTSGTLQYIQTQLKQQLHPDLKVVPVQ